MQLHFKKHGENKEASHRLSLLAHDYLRHRFMLKTEYLDHLRCFEADGEFQERPVRQIRVFDPALAKQRGLDIRTCADLEAHPECLAFEGHIDAGGTVYFADRRTRRPK